MDEWIYVEEEGKYFNLNSLVNFCFIVILFITGYINERP
jgi:hypothetical protein